MIIKLPPCYDVSHHKTINDFRAVTPRPYFMITKATEHITFKDDKFIPFFAGMRQIGCHRGVYHFNRKAYSAVAQAEFFITTVSPYITDNDILILDVEEGGEKAADILAWFDYVRVARPRNRVLLYSARYILEQMAMTAAQKEAMQKIPVWTAGYPADPDKYDEIPAWYTPDPTRFGPVVMWQYSADGQITGIEGDVDLNLITPTYRQVLGEQPEPIEEEPVAKNKVTITYDAGARERREPHAAGEYGTILPDNSVHYSDFDPVPDMDDPTNPDKRWIKLQSNWYIANRYPSSSGVVERARVEPILSSDTVTADIDMDLTMDVNGAKYHTTIMLSGVQLKPVE